jgi:hypothetical protein
VVLGRAGQVPGRDHEVAELSAAFMLGRMMADGGTTPTAQPGQMMAARSIACVVLPVMIMCREPVAGPSRTSKLIEY